MKRKDFHMIEPDRDIILHCDDFMGDYVVEGRFTKPSGYIKNVFCTYEEESKRWVKNSKEWNQRNSWEYR